MTCTMQNSVNYTICCQWTFRFFQVTDLIISRSHSVHCGCLFSASSKLVSAILWFWVGLSAKFRRPETKSWIIYTLLIFSLEARLSHQIFSAWAAKGCPENAEESYSDSNQFQHSAQCMPMKTFYQDQMILKVFLKYLVNIAEVSNNSHSNETKCYIEA